MVKNNSVKKNIFYEKKGGTKKVRKVRKVLKQRGGMNEWGNKALPLAKRRKIGTGAGSSRKRKKNNGDNLHTLSANNYNSKIPPLNNNEQHSKRQRNLENAELYTAHLITEEKERYGYVKALDSFTKIVEHIVELKNTAIYNQLTDYIYKPFIKESYKQPDFNFFDKILEDGYTNNMIESLLVKEKEWKKHVNIIVYFLKTYVIDQIVFKSVMTILDLLHSTIPCLFFLTIIEDLYQFNRSLFKKLFNTSLTTATYELSYNYYEVKNEYINKHINKDIMEGFYSLQYNSKDLYEWCCRNNYFNDFTVKMLYKMMNIVFDGFDKNANFMFKIQDSHPKDPILENMFDIFCIKIANLDEQFQSFKTGLKKFDTDKSRNSRKVAEWVLEKALQDSNVNRNPVTFIEFYICNKLQLNKYTYEESKFQKWLDDNPEPVSLKYLHKISYYTVLVPEERTVVRGGGAERGIKRERHKQERRGPSLIGGRRKEQKTKKNGKTNMKIRKRNSKKRNKQIGGSKHHIGPLFETVKYQTDPAFNEWFKKAIKIETMKAALSDKFLGVFTIALVALASCTSFDKNMKQMDEKTYIPAYDGLHYDLRRSGNADDDDLGIKKFLGWKERETLTKSNCMMFVPFLIVKGQPVMNHSAINNGATKSSPLQIFLKTNWHLQFDAGKKAPLDIYYEHNCILHKDQATKVRFVGKDILTGGAKNATKLSKAQAPTPSYIDTATSAVDGMLACTYESPWNFKQYVCLQFIKGSSNDITEPDPYQGFAINFQVYWELHILFNKSICLLPYHFHTNDQLAGIQKTHILEAYNFIEMLQARFVLHGNQIPTEDPTIASAMGASAMGTLAPETGIYLWVKDEWCCMTGDSNLSQSHVATALGGEGYGYAKARSVPFPHQSRLLIKIIELWNDKYDPTGLTKQEYNKINNPILQEIIRAFKFIGDRTYIVDALLRLVFTKEPEIIRTLDRPLTGLLILILEMISSGETEWKTHINENFFTYIKEYIFSNNWEKGYNEGVINRLPSNDKKQTQIFEMIKIFHGKFAFLANKPNNKIHQVFVDIPEAQAIINDAIANGALVPECGGVMGFAIDPTTAYKTSIKKIMEIIKDFTQWESPQILTDDASTCTGLVYPTAPPIPSLSSSSTPQAFMDMFDMEDFVINLENYIRNQYTLCNTPPLDLTQTLNIWKQLNQHIKVLFELSETQPVDNVPGIIVQNYPQNYKSDVEASFQTLFISSLPKYKISYCLTYYTFLKEVVSLKRKLFILQQDNNTETYNDSNLFKIDSYQVRTGIGPRNKPGPTGWTTGIVATLHTSKTGFRVLGDANALGWILQFPNTLLPSGQISANELTVKSWIFFGQFLNSFTKIIKKGMEYNILYYVLCSIFKDDEVIQQVNYMFGFIYKFIEVLNIIIFKLLYNDTSIGITSEGLEVGNDTHPRFKSQNSGHIVNGSKPGPKLGVFVDFKETTENANMLIKAIWFLMSNGGKYNLELNKITNLLVDTIAEIWIQFYTLKRTIQEELVDKIAWLGAGDGVRQILKDIMDSKAVSDDYSTAFTTTTIPPGTLQDIMGPRFNGQYLFTENFIIDNNVTGLTQAAAQVAAQAAPVAPAAAPAAQSPLQAAMAPLPAASLPLPAAAPGAS